jgi:hypothetical protein
MSAYSRKPDESDKRIHSIYDTGGQHVVVTKPPLPELKILPPLVYRLNYDEKADQIAFSNEDSSFQVPEVIHGAKYRAYLEMIWKEYRKQTIALGVLLTGVKGSGKSLLAELLGNKMITGMRPVIIIDKKVSIDVILRMLKIAGPCMVYFDEMSKYFDREEQDRLLPLFSNTSIKETLFVVADNDTSRLSEYIQDRPGRFLYHIRFDGIGKDICDEICGQYKLLPQVMEHIHAYIVENKISIDVMRILAAKAAETKSYEEYLLVFETLNIPKPTFRELNVLITFPAGLSDEEKDKIKANIKVVKKSPEDVIVTHLEEKIELRSGSRWDNKANLGRLLVTLDYKSTSTIQPPPGAELKPAYAEEAGGEGRRVSRY